MVCCWGRGKPSWWKNKKNKNNTLLTKPDVVSDGCCEVLNVITKVLLNISQSVILQHSIRLSPAPTDHCCGVLVEEGCLLTRGLYVWDSCIRQWSDVSREGRAVSPSKVLSPLVLQVTYWVKLVSDFEISIWFESPFNMRRASGCHISRSATVE